MFFLVGLNHKSAPLEVRERFAMDVTKAAEFCQQCVTGRPGGEVVLISTCNRVEAVFHVDEEKDCPPLVERFREQGGGTCPEAFYLLQNREAITHLYRVASGLDSLVLGEPQILGQVKDAYHHGVEAGTVHRNLEFLFQQTFHVAKRIRTHTGIGQHPASIASVAVDLARNFFQDLSRKEVLLVGAGEMGRLVAKHLIGAGVTNVTLINRTQANAIELAEDLGEGRVEPWDQLPSLLPRVDVVVTSTGAPMPVISRELLKKTVAKRRGRPLFMVDIAVPRDVEPEASDLGGLYLYGIDDLQQVASQGKAWRKREAEQAEALVREAAEKFIHQARGKAEGGLIAQVMASVEEIINEETAQYLRRNPGLKAENAEEAVRLARSVARKILHAPMSELRHAAEDDAETTETLRRFFNLLGKD